MPPDAPIPLLLPEYLESLLAPYTPLTPPLVPQGGVTYLIKTRQVTQMSYAALYKHVALFAVTYLQICTYVT